MSNDDPDQFNLLRKIHKSQVPLKGNWRNILVFSLGKLNYCMKALKAKGLIKIENFKKNKSKLNYLYVITPKGIAEKTKLTVRFMKRKMNEYDELKNEYEKEKNKK